jgi:hypothetical protein
LPNGLFRRNWIGKLILRVLNFGKHL